MINGAVMFAQFIQHINPCNLASDFGGWLGIIICSIIVIRVQQYAAAVFGVIGVSWRRIGSYGERLLRTIHLHVEWSEAGHTGGDRHYTLLADDTRRVIDAKYLDLLCLYKLGG